MSSNKRQKLNTTVIKNRQSFDDRIDDDLSEVILQYLPFNDKFKLESVSKQFQSTIFSKVFKYIIEDFDAFPVYVVLNKCPNIHYLNFKEYSVNEEKVNEYNLIIDLIIELLNCNNLTRIECYFNSMDNAIREKFIKKVAPKLKSFKFIDTNDGRVVQYFPNIEGLYLFMSDLSLKDNIIPLKGLKTLKIEFDTQYDMNIFSTFITTHPLIENLNLVFFSKDIFKYNHVLTQISSLKHLAKLEIKYPPDVRNRPEFGISIRKIAVNCPKLRTLHYDIPGQFDSYIELNQCFSLLKPLKHINRLYLNFAFKPTVEDFSCKLFESFEKITHLKLYFWKKIHVKDTILADIDIYLPKLKYLDIENAVFITTDEIPIIPSRLKSLHTIKLNIRDNSEKEILKTKLSEQKKLKIIELNSNDSEESSDSDSE